MKARPYQIEAEKGAFQCWADGNRSVLVVMPTGTGKTVLLASIIRRRFPKRAMVIAHRQELIWQARDKIQKVTGLTVDVEMGEFKARTSSDMLHPKASVVVSTVQTHVAGGDGAGRIGKFDPKDFGLLIIDEAHHATSASYRRIIDYYTTNLKLVVLGVTATPDRADEQALGQVFDVVAYDYEVLDAIKDGWLVPIEQQMVSIESLDFNKVRTTAGDLNQADLDSVMSAEKNLHGIASATIDIIGKRRGIGFASSVNHARMLSEIFNRHRFGMSNFVCAGTKTEERKKIISDFAAGKIQWLWNCGVFTEGFDDSGVEVISMGRPTKSRALYAQMAGRATRPHESIAHRLNDVTIAALRRMMIARSCKPSCLIVDFVGNSGKHKLMTTADILGGNLSEQAVENASIEARRSGKPMRMDQVIVDEEKKLEEMKRKRLEQEARRARLVGKATFKTQTVDPFDVLQIKPVVARGWDKGKQFSEPQRERLKKMGVNPDELDYARGRQLLDIFYDRIKNKKCTIPQAGLLERCGWPKEQVVNMGFDEASQAITATKLNRWKKPDNFKYSPPQTEATHSSNPEPHDAAEPTGEIVEPFTSDDVPF